VQLGRIAKVSRIFIEEGLGFLVEGRKNASEDDDAGDDAKALPPGEDEAEASTDEPDEESKALAEREASDAELGKRLRRTLERLGPTFVKFGQLLGTRVDLFSEPFIAELGKLHSEVTPFPTEEARKIVEAELGRPIDEVFEDFPDEPVAAASIAQVYEARLRGEDEESSRRVAVKVQRPNLEETLIPDLEVLIDISGFVDRIVPPYRRSMVHKVAKEYARRARGELDFLSEARAIEQFSQVMRSLPEFRVPSVHHDFCTERLLVMEWLDGRKLDTVPDAGALAELGFEPTAFARSMLKLQVSMAYEHGFVHGDTHPGNIILLPTGHIALIDFGLHGQVPRALRDKMLEMIFYQTAGRFDEAVDSFASVFKPDPTSDIDAFKAEMRQMLEADAGPRALADRRITEQLIKGMRVGAKYKLEAQSDLLMVIRNLTIVEGIVLRYCPTVDTDAELQTIVSDIMRRKVFGPSMREEMTQLLPQILLTVSQRPRLAERLLQLERSFVASKSLGEFLRQEKVLALPTRDGQPLWKSLAIALVGAAIGALLHALLAG
jgi:ubiquinone biosynthesis protein